MSIVLKDRIYGFHYTNMSKSDKTVTVAFQLTEDSAYYFNITFPKCYISYVFLFYDTNNNNQLTLSGKAAKNLADAMNQSNFADRIALKVISVFDKEQKSINFFKLDTDDQNFTADLFNLDCTLTSTANVYKNLVRTNLIDNQGGVNYNWFAVDGPYVADASSADSPPAIEITIDPLTSTTQAGTAIEPPNYSSPTPASIVPNPY